MHTNRIQQGNKKNLKLRQNLRTNMTYAENKLWFQLKGKQFNDIKFRRQHGIGPYIVDFYCPTQKLIIEIDGDSHTMENQIIIDQERENYLKKLGLNILRYNNSDIMQNLDGVMEDLQNYIDKHSTSPTPPYKGGE